MIPARASEQKRGVLLDYFVGRGRQVSKETPNLTPVVTYSPYFLPFLRSIKYGNKRNQALSIGYSYCVSKAYIKVSC